MKRTSTALVAALLILGSCGSDDPQEPEKTVSSPSPQPNTSPEPTTPAPTKPAPAPADLVVEPGRVGPAVAGMSKAVALKTGLFDADVPPPVEGCPPYPLKWKKKYKGVDVLTRDDGSISSIGVFKGGPKTSKGIGYGSTLDDLTEAYPNLSPVVDAGFNQAGAYEFTDTEFIGFLFGDATVSDIKGSSRISFIEVTVGDKPDLIRSGC